MKRVLVTALAAGGLLLLPLSAPGATTAQGASLTIRLISTAGQINYRDRPPQGPSKGDVLSGPSILRNAVAQFGRPNGAVVGHDYEVLTLSSPTVGVANVRVYLPGGTLRVKGRINASASAGTIQVVGGTGRYANARGTSYIRDLSGRRSLNVYHLQIP